MAKVNPFRPNSPVHSDMFAGRTAELRKLESCLIQTKAGNPSNFMLTGERGIGKSSLLNYIKFVAEGEIDIEGDTVRFLAIDTDIDSNTTQLGLMAKITLGLDKTLGDTEKGRDFLKQSWEFLKRVEGGGFKLRTEDQPNNDERLLEEFAYSLSAVAERVCSEGDSTFLGFGRSPAGWSMTGKRFGKRLFVVSKKERVWKWKLTPLFFSVRL